MANDSLAFRVHKVFLDCLYQPEEIKDATTPPLDAKIVEGITMKFALHPKRLALHRQEVKDFLDQMPNEFRADKGGGWSFLNLCMDKNGRQWGEHPTMQELVVLGIALGMVEYCMPRDMWDAFPGGMPYITIDTNKE